MTVPVSRQPLCRSRPDRPPVALVECCCTGRIVRHDDADPKIIATNISGALSTHRSWQQDLRSPWKLMDHPTSSGGKLHKFDRPPIR